MRRRVRLCAVVACGRSISGPAHPSSAAFFLPPSNTLPAAPISRRGEQHNKYCRGRLLTATPPTGDTSFVPKARVAQHRDANDDWVEGALFQRSGKSSDGPAPIFKTAAMVVDHFLDPDANCGSDVNDSTRYPLRRVHEDGNNDEPHWSERMFAPLFGLLATTTQSESDDAKGVPRHGRLSQRANLKITLAYRGLDFCGWEDQRHELYRSENGIIRDSDRNDTQTLPSVQGTLVDVLGSMLGKDEEAIIPPSADAETNMKQTRGRKSKPIVIKVAGRTDAGVSAISQVCRIRTWKEMDGIENYLKDAVNKHVSKRGGGLRIRNVEFVGDEFHPTFGATSRAYAYMIDLEEEDGERTSIPAHLVPRMDRMLRTLEGKELDYVALSYGKVKTKTTLCTLYHARAELVELRGNDFAQKKERAICIQLVGDRFLRRMVRILVATALREANREDDCHHALLDILLTKDRRYRAKAAPPGGLVFVGAEYSRS